MDWLCTRWDWSAWDLLKLRDGVLCFSQSLQMKWCVSIFSIDVSSLPLFHLSPSEEWSQFHFRSCHCQSQRGGGRSYILVQVDSGWFSDGCISYLRRYVWRPVVKFGERHWTCVLLTLKFPALFCLPHTHDPDKKESSHYVLCIHFWLCLIPTLKWTPFVTTYNGISS